MATSEEFEKYLSDRIEYLVKRDKRDHLYKLECECYDAIKNIIYDYARKGLFLAKELDDRFIKITDYIAALHELLNIKDELNDVMNKQRHIRMMRKMDQEFKEKEI